MKQFLCRCFGMLVILSICIVYPVSAEHNPYGGIDVLAYDSKVADNRFSDSEGYLAGMYSGANVLYKNVNFGSISPYGVTVTVGAHKDYASQLALYIDSVREENKIATIVPECMGWTVEHDNTVPLIKEVTGIHNLYLMVEKRKVGGTVYYGPQNIFGLKFYIAAGEAVFTDVKAEPLSGRISIDFAEDIALSESSYAVAVREISGRKTICRTAVKGKTLYLYYDSAYLAEGNYQIELFGVNTASGKKADGFSFYLKNTGLFPITRTVFKKGENSLTAERRFKNGGSSPVSVYSLAGAYNGGKLNAAAKETVTVTAGETKLVHQVLQKSGTGKQFLFDGLEKIQPLAPVSAEKTADSFGTAGDYVIEYTMPFALNGNEVSKEYFSLTNISDNSAAEIKNVTYFPKDKTLKLFLNAKAADNAGMCLSFNSDTNSFSDMVYANQSFKAERSGAGVTELTFYADGERVYQPVSGKTLLVRARIENNTPDKIPQLKYRAVSAENNNTVLFSDTTAVPAEGSTEISFLLTKKDWKNGETIQIILD